MGWGRRGRQSLRELWTQRPRLARPFCVLASMYQLDMIKHLKSSYPEVRCRTAQWPSP